MLGLIIVPSGLTSPPDIAASLVPNVKTEFKVIVTLLCARHPVSLSSADTVAISGDATGYAKFTNA